MTSCIGSKCFKNRSSSITKNICNDLTPDVIGIIHYTNYKNLLSIIKDSQITTKIELLKNKSYNKEYDLWYVFTKRN